MKKLVVILITIILTALPVNAKEHQVYSIEQEIYEKYSNDIEVEIISWSEYESIKHNFKNSKIIYLSQNFIDDKNSSFENNTSKKEIQQDTQDTKEDDVRTSTDVQLRIPNINLPSDDAAAVFIVIGIVVVAVLVVYAGEYIYEVITTDKKHSYWIDNSFIASSFYNDSNNNYGSMAGFKIASGINDKNVKVGLSAEIGNFNFNFSGINPIDWLDTKGNYLMAGPAIRFYPNNSTIHFFIEMLGGKSDNKEIDTIGHARFGINKTMPNNMVFGISYGALFVGIDDKEGIIQNSNNFETTVSLEAGYRF